MTETVVAWCWYARLDSSQPLNPLYLWAAATIGCSHMVKQFLDNLIVGYGVFGTGDPGKYLYGLVRALVFFSMDLLNTGLALLTLRKAPNGGRTPTSILLAGVAVLLLVLLSSMSGYD